MLKWIIRIYVLLFTAIYIGCTPSSEYLREKGIPEISGKDIVRVLIEQTDRRISVACHGKFRVTDSVSGKILKSSNSSEIVIHPEKLSGVIVVDGWDSPLSLNGRKYRGRFEIRNHLGKMLVINLVSMDDYLKSVVPSEIPNNWPVESLKAQAVAARTYALFHMQKKSSDLYDLESCTNSQVYKGIASENEATSKAVDETRDMVITYNYEPIQAYFHSTCGGKTTDSRYVWSGDGVPYLKSVNCNYCSDSKHYNWSYTLSLYELNYAMRNKFPSVGKIQNISFKKKDGRVVDVRIRHENGVAAMTGNEFRLLMDPKKIKSLLFESKVDNNGLRIEGHGWGHGVGMCQWGARGMALTGKNFKEILTFYYKGVDIRKLNRATGVKNNSFIK